MTESELFDLDHELAQGPRLVRDAVFGACVGAAVSWLGYSGSKNLFASAVQGAGVGATLALLSYGFEQWKSSREHVLLGSGLPRHVAGALAPYPCYAPSVTYPWSSH
jgi:hypothetical protein